MRSYYAYWGKARKEEGIGAPYHLLPYHCLDVAAVADVLIREHKGIRNHLLKLSGLEEEKFISWVRFFLAIHDLGKFSESFQNLRPDLLMALQGRKSNKGYALRHDSLGYMLWRNNVREWLLSGQQRRRGSIPLSGFDYWASAVVGHHGFPPKLAENDFDYFSERDKSAAMEFVEAVSGIFIPGKEGLHRPNIVDSKHLSWWLAGFAVLCDWLGSDSRVFTYNTDEMPLLAYWDSALSKAENVVRAAQLIPAEAAPIHPLRSLFSPGFETPTPLQSLCNEVPLDASPQLFILEDVTGAGKTEASIILLHRMMAKGYAEGVYFALPTMATANAMYERMVNVYRRLYNPGSNPSLILAHGARDLSPQFRQSIISDQPVYLSGYGDGTETASAHCSSWLADNRKKAFLAEMGVGTIDQSLLALLPSKHQSLRMLGLLGKVLIVDEVHACDAYVNELLCAVLKAHASSGGSAILLSATLPAAQRQKLLDAFSEGCGRAKFMIGPLDKKAYPLLTHYAMGRYEEHVVGTRKSAERSIKINVASDVAMVLVEIKKKILAGGCACWIRNTVDDAREAYELVKEHFPEQDIDLFHARYAMADRLAIEDKVLCYFGRNSTPDLRRGRVLIATQVVEQSLDIDFDFMVTDLAPIDLIIQRAGRLCRHTRSLDGLRVEGGDQRGVPVLVVHGPDPSGRIDADWYKSHFKRAAGIYPNHAQLWLTAKLLAVKRGFEMPGDARELIEGVYGCEVYPETLQNHAWNSEGEDSAKRGLAMLNMLKLDAGYGGGQENCWWDEVVTPTRLGEQTITVYLARWDGVALSPWAGGADHPWPGSAVQVRKALICAGVNDDIPQELLDACKQQLPAQGKWGTLLVLKEIKQETWGGLAIGPDEHKRVVEYDNKLGLRVK